MRCLLGASVLSFVAGALASGWLFPALLTSAAMEDAMQRGPTLVRKVMELGGMCTAQLLPASFPFQHVCFGAIVMM